MGYLLYGSSRERVLFDDRTLLHLQLLCSAKLRQREGFFLSWEIERGSGSGRQTVWIAPSIPLVFRYSSPRPEEVDREWMSEIISTARNRGHVVLQSATPEQ